MTKLFQKASLLILLSFLISVSLSSCIEKDVHEGGDDNKPEEEEFFDFAMKSGVTLDIDYNLSELINGNYQVVFELYDVDPFIYDESGNSVLKEGIKPIYSAWTDKDGRYKKEVILPSALKEVYLVSSFIGAVKVVKLDVTDGFISFDRKDYQGDTKTKSGTLRADYTYPANWQVLGSWDSNGSPDYLMDNITFPSKFINDMNGMFISGDKGQSSPELIYNKYPEFFADPTTNPNAKTDMDIHIIKDTEVSIALIKCDANNNNMLGYYVYKTSERPSSKEDIENLFVLFPHVSRRAPLSVGNQVKLKFPTEEGLVNVFPAGYSIGFVLSISGFNGGNVSADKLIYGDYRFNEVDEYVNGRRAVALFDPMTEQLIALGFEDLPSWDKDFDDALFSIHTSEKNAVDTEDMPELEGNDDDKVAEYTVRGTLLYEDLWPSKGDYDMNDLVVTYDITVSRDKDNNITKVVDIFTPVWNGASFKNGFGYQYGNNIVKGDISSINIESVNPASTFMQGQDTEPGQSYQTIVLLDDMSAIELGESYTITTEFKKGAVSDILPPYNPFIIINSDKGRGHELHQINKTPTDLVDGSKFGTSDDKSKPGEGVYYVASEDYPFSLDIPVINFRVPKETVKIHTAYPEYNKWVESKNTNAKDWYLNPKTSEVEEY